MASAAAEPQLDKNGIKFLDDAVDFAGSTRDADLQRVAATLCGWTSQDAAIFQISGGITNLLFKMSPKDGQDPVLIRVFGAKTEMMINRERDNIVFHQLAEAKFGPSMYGYFKNGRIEGFFDARPLEPSEMGQLQPRDMPQLIGTELARMHCLQVPEPKQPMLWTQIDSWMAQASLLSFEADSETDKKAKFAAIDLKQVARDIEAVRGLLPSDVNSNGVDLLDSGAMEGESAAQAAGRRAARELLFEVVFSHNDLLSGNILALADDESRVQLIDFEYGGYNYAGFDVGNHFCEHAGFDFDLDKWYPKQDVAVHFLKAYVARRMPDAASAAAGHFSGEDAAACEAAFWLEGVRVANMFALASHFFWGLWAVIQAKHSPIDFDFMQYAVERLVNGFGKHRESFLQPELSLLKTPTD